MGEAVRQPARPTREAIGVYERALNSLTAIRVIECPIVFMVLPDQVGERVRRHRLDRRLNLDTVYARLAYDAVAATDAAHVMSGCLHASQGQTQLRRGLGVQDQPCDRPNDDEGTGGDHDQSLHLPRPSIAAEPL